MDRQVCRSGTFCRVAGRIGKHSNRYSLQPGHVGGGCQIVFPVTLGRRWTRHFLVSGHLWLFYGGDFRKRHGVADRNRLHGFIIRRVPPVFKRMTQKKASFGSAGFGEPDKGEMGTAVAGFWLEVRYGLVVFPGFATAFCTGMGCVSSRTGNG